MHSVKEPGCPGGKREQKTFSFELPVLEPDISEEAQGGGVTNRTSKAVVFKDSRSGRKKLHLANDDGDEEDEEKFGPTIELAPSCLG